MKGRSEGGVSVADDRGSVYSQGGLRMAPKDRTGNRKKRGQKTF